MEKADKDKRPYITVTNELFRHPKFRRLSDKAKLYLLELWGTCNEFQTDGLIEHAVLHAQGKKVADELLNGWVETTKTAGVYYMHDYLVHQKSKVEIELHKAKKSTAGAIGAHTRHHEKKGIFDISCEYCQAARTG